MLLLMKGMPGSGKSTLARALSRRLGWALIDKDDIKDIIDGHAADSGRLAYDVMLNIAHRQLRLGNSVICDSPLTFASLYIEGQQIARAASATLAIIECHCSDESLWQQRINSRKAMNLPAHHQTEWDGLQSYRQSVTGVTDYPISDPYLILDTVTPLDELAGRAAQWLEDLVS